MVTTAALIAGTGDMPDSVDADYGLSSTCEILLTSAKGDRLAIKENVNFENSKTGEIIIHVQPHIIKQTLHGIGGSFTESSAFVLAHLSKSQRQEVMDRIYGDQGANFSLARTVIGASDFSVEGKFSYDDIKEDRTLKYFSIAPDLDGFSNKKYPAIQDTEFDVLPMIKQAFEIKHQQNDSDLKIIASAWTAPAWMKDIEDWYIPGDEKNNYHGTGGSLKHGYEKYYADYLIRYLEEYSRQGVKLWGITPVNEPNGNNGQWESMHFSAESQNDFIKHHLGPALQRSKYDDVKLLIYDHNRDGLEHWAHVLYSDDETSQYLYGAAVHWYESTFKVYEDVLERVHNTFPQYVIIHTEGTIDDLGKDAPPGITDPVRFKESGWFDNDSFWWNDNATDWAYSATWAGVNADDHPIYTPVHRYARNIITSLNHWVSGWIDWNTVLDKDGGPNHAGNYCGAPIMIDTDSDYVYYTPVFHVLSQFSRTIRPGDKAVEVTTSVDRLEHDAIHASASINKDSLLSVQVLNTTKKPIEYQLQIGNQFAAVTIEANALQTVRVQL
ncbi:MAG: glycoside hydrolase family 30 beta sandwich domain-containing protein [Gammaproteobacteria bacterium]|jgi:glucosylceramidase